MENSIALLSATAVSLGFIHTILGPDHYLAFKPGFSRINLKPIEKYSNVIAGAMIFLSGVAIRFLGL